MSTVNFDTFLLLDIDVDNLPPSSYELEIAKAREEGREVARQINKIATNPYRGINEQKAIAWDAGYHEIRNQLRKSKG